MVLFLFQFYPVCNFGIYQFGFGIVRSERLTNCNFDCFGFHLNSMIKVPYVQTVCCKVLAVFLQESALLYNYFFRAVSFSLTEVLFRSASP